MAKQDLLLVRLAADSGARRGELAALFFFYCYGHHRDLHSFPTRRSSDLAQRPASANFRLRIASSQDSAGLARFKLASFASDRKSTRLNSSHVRISYAV